MRSAYSNLVYLTFRESGNGKQRGDGFWDENAPKSEAIPDLNMPLLVIGTKQVRSKT